VIPSQKKVRFVPDWFPGAGFKRLARVARARGEHMVDGAFNAAKEAMNGDDSIPSLVGALLSREGPNEMTRDEYEFTIKWAAGSLYGGAYLRTFSSSSLSGIRLDSQTHLLSLQLEQSR